MKKICRMYILVILILIMLFCILAFIKTKSSKEVKKEIDILEYQHSIDKNYNCFGYTLDNMNIIINPYDISPLTALIMFQTDSNEKIEVTIKGKNDDDLVYTYSETKNHNIIIYGLYPNYDNEIIIRTNGTDKKIYIKTDDIPKDFIMVDNSNENELNFNNSNYLYAVDKHNELRWILTDKNGGNISITNNNHLIVGTNEKFNNNNYTGIQEIDLLGKIYYQYIVKYSGLNKTSNNNIYIINKKNIFIIDRQTGEKKQKKSMILDNQINSLSFENQNIKFKKGIRFGENTETKVSSNKISLLNYKKNSQEYKKNNIKFCMKSNRFEIDANFTKNDKYYLILDKLFDRRIYKLTKDYNYVNSAGLMGKYDIYIKINEVVYKTDYYVSF